MARIGYIRVSTNDQNTDLQREALVRAKCEQIFDDKISGTKANRPGLKRALKYLQAGDTLVVWNIPEKNWPLFITCLFQQYINILPVLRPGNKLKARTKWCCDLRTTGNTFLYAGGEPVVRNRSMLSIACIKLIKTIVFIDR